VIQGRKLTELLFF